MALTHSFLDIHFDFGAIKELAPEMASRGIRKSIIITDETFKSHFNLWPPKKPSLEECGQLVIDALG